MPTHFEVLSGLPASGPKAIDIPPESSRFGREGTVVRFGSQTGEEWTGNFALGLDGVTDALAHPNGQHVLVLSRGDLWVVDPATRRADNVAIAIFAAWPVTEPDGWVFSRQHLALLRLAATGVTWHTRQLSWDGFDQIAFDGSRIKGRGWNAIDQAWIDFTVDLRTGRSVGGAYAHTDAVEWERLALDG